MKYASRIVLAAGLALGLSVAGASAQAPQPKQAPAVQLKPASPAAVAAAKEILAMKNVSSMYQGAVPGMIQRVKDTLMQSNLNYQKDLNEVSLVLAQKLAGRENEIGDQMAKIYASDFTEQELKDLVTFYKTPLGQKLLLQEPKSIQSSMSYMNEWAQTFSEEINGQFRAEMRKRGKEI
jgi:hypothetical protein